MPEQTLKIVLTGDGGGLVEVLDDSADGFDEVGESAEKAGKKAKQAGNQLGFVEREARKLFTGTRNLVNGLGGLKAMLAGLGVGALAKQFIDAASTSEQLRVRLRVLLGSVAEGNRLFQDMADFASRVPFEFENIIGAATTLTGALGGGVDEVNRIIPLVADLAAASGLTIETATEQVVRLFNAGALSAEILKDKGLLALVGLQAGVSMSAEETKKTVIASYESMDSRIKGATEALAQTWAGGLSMVSDKWFAFRNLVMDAGVFDYLKSVVAVVDEELATGLDGSKQAAELWAATIIEGIEQVVAGAGVMADGFHGVRIGFKALELGWDGVQLALLTGIDVVLTALLDLKTEYAGFLQVARFIPGINLPAIAIDKLLDTEKLKSGRDAIRLWKADVETSVATVKKELDGLATFLPSQELEGFMERMRAKFEENKAASDALENALDDLGDAAGAAGKKTKPLTTEQIAARKATDDLKKSLQFELDQLKRNDREKAIANALRGLSTEQIRLEGDEIERLAGLLYDEEAAIRAATAAEEERIRDLEKTAEAQAEAFRRPFENALDGVQDAGVDMFEDIFSGGVNSAKDFGRTLKDLFIRLSAELAALLVFRPVLSGIGLAGASGAANAGGLSSFFNGGGSSGGGFSIGNAASIPFNLAGDALRYLGGLAGDAGFVGTQRLLSSGVANLNNANPFTSGLAGFAGNFGANALFGNDRGVGANIGGTLGAIAGAALPIPIVGPAIGSFLGNAIGGLFGGGEPSPPKFHVRGSANPFSAGTDNQGNARTVEGFGALGGLQFSAQHIADDNSFLENQPFIDSVVALDNQIAGMLSDRALELARSAAESFTFDSEGSVDIGSVLRNRAQVIGGGIGAIGGVDQSISRALTLGTSFEQLQEDLQLIEALAGGASGPAQALADGIEALDRKFAGLTERAADLGLPLSRLNDLREAEKRQLEQTLGLGGVRDLLTGLTATGTSPLDQQTVLGNANQLYLDTLRASEAGDQLALNQLAGVSSNLIGQLESMFSHGETFFEGVLSRPDGGFSTIGMRPLEADVVGFNQIKADLERLLGIPGFDQGGISTGLGFVHANEGVVPLDGNRAIGVTLNPGLVEPVVRAIEISQDSAAANDEVREGLMLQMIAELRLNNKLLREASQRRAVAR